MARGASPTLRRRELGALLRTYRDENSLTATEVAAALDIDASQISRIENAQRRPNPLLVRELCRLYGLDGETTAHLLQLTRESREQGWWQRYDLEAPTATLASLEDAAAKIENFEIGIFPGLLQTLDYANAVVRSVRGRFTEARLRKTVESRTARQRILTRERPVELHVIVDEGVLHRSIGGFDVMRAQLRHVLSAASLPNVRIQVLPFSAPSNPGLDGSFAILSFAEAHVPDVAYAEGQLGQTFDDKPEEVGRCRHVFETLTHLAADPESSLTIIDTQLRAFSST